MTKPDLTDKEGSRFPEEFISIIRNQLGSEYIDFLEAHKEVPSKSIRLNEFKRIPVNPEWVPVPWCKTGYVLQEKPEFLKDPFFHAGAYYVQEASSMFLDHVVRHIRSDLPEQSLALDVCGAPGGKTLILADALPSDSLVISSEIKLKRRFILEYNIVKWGKENIMLARTNRMLLRDLEPLFDLVLIDAPCSGEGLFRKTNLAIQQWSIQKVKYCSKRQHRILKDNLSLLRPGGYLIYSTCTYNDEENMDQIKWLANNDFESISVPINSDWGIVKKENGKAAGYQFYPHRAQGEGYFIAILKKTGLSKRKITSSGQAPRWKKLQISQGVEFFPINKKFIHSLYRDFKSNVYYINPNWIDKLRKLIKPMGITPTPIGSLINRVFHPYHALSLSRMLDQNVLKLPLDHPTSIKMLQKQNLKMENPVRGWHLATYNDLPLGWLKGVGDKFKNYYPTHLRIPD